MRVITLNTTYSKTYKTMANARDAAAQACNKIASGLNPRVVISAVEGDDEAHTIRFAPVFHFSQDEVHRAQEFARAGFTVI